MQHVDLGNAYLHLTRLSASVVSGSSLLRYACTVWSNQMLFTVDHNTVLIMNTSVYRC